MKICKIVAIMCLMVLMITACNQPKTTSDEVSAPQSDNAGNSNDTAADAQAKRNDIKTTDSITLENKENLAAKVANEDAAKDVQVDVEKSGMNAPITDSIHNEKIDEGIIAALAKDSVNPNGETMAPPATEGFTCTNWNNALFIDGTELYYKIKIERENAAEEDNEDFETEIEFYVSCLVKLEYATDDYCGSTVKCEIDPKYIKYKGDADPLPVTGSWFIDKNGIYYMRYFGGFVKANGKPCKAKYAKCEPGTLIAEYDGFGDPIIPTVPGVKVYEVYEDPETFAISKMTVSRKGQSFVITKLVVICQMTILYAISAQMTSKVRPVSKMSGMEHQTLS